MHIGRLFQNNPLEALAILLCLATILYCVGLVYRHRNQLDRSLISLLGCIAVYQILRVVKDAGFAFEQLRWFDVTLNVMVSCLYLGAAMILRISCADRSTTKVQLRLVEANEKTVARDIRAPQSSSELSAAMVEASPLAMFTVNGQGLVNSWNAAAERVLGWKKREVLGRQPPLPVTHESPVPSSLRFQTRSGEEISAAAWTVCLRANSGGAGGRLTVLAPLSELHDVAPAVLATIGE